MMMSCLFIGSEEADLEIFKNALHDVHPGAACFSSDNGLDAVRLMDDYDLVPDLIIMELEGTGYEALWFLHSMKRHPIMRDVPVIIHSPVAHPEKVDMLRDCGATAIYFKPYEYTGICNLLNLYVGTEFTNFQLN